MPAAFARAGALAYDLQELVRPSGSRRTALTTEFMWSVSPEANRRRAPRINVAASDVVIHVEDQIVKAVDLSLRGVQFETRVPLGPGASVILHVGWQSEEKSLALGRVMWAALEKPDRLMEPRYRVGVLLENADVRMIRSILARCGFGQHVRIQVVY